MRVISGSARGTLLKTPEGALTRPTADRVKEAMFSILQFALPGAAVLDLFGGTGQLGIEALSRGAASAVFVDHREDACRLIRENLKKTHLEQRGTVVRGDYMDYLNRCGRKFDVILLDISMPVLNGMEVAKRLRAIDSDVVLLFVTNLAQYAIRGYEVRAFDYILKPIHYFPFSQRLSRAVGRVKSKTKNYLVLNAREGMQKLDVNTIFYVESRDHDLIFHTESGIFTLGGTMKDVEQRLQPYSFFRCNKGYLVSLRHVDSVQDGCALVHGQKLLISRTRKNEFMEALINYVGGAVL